MTHALTKGARIVVASHNAGKVREIDDLIAPYGLRAVSAGQLGLPEPEETEATFAGNARLKAVAAALASGLPALSDDSGLEVEALAGAPGIYSARWAGPSKDFTAAMRKVRDDVVRVGRWTSPKGEGGTGPRANFTCVLCLAWPDGTNETFEGKVFGHLVWPPRGANGFGYDAMFVADDAPRGTDGATLTFGDPLTFGEMSADDKHAISHRARAFAKFKSWLPSG